MIGGAAGTSSDPTGAMPPGASTDVILLAPLCRDEIVERSRVRTRPGGAGFYAAWALARRGCRIRLHTPLADGDRDLLDALPDQAEVVVHPSRATTRFRIEIDPDSPNQRRLSVVDACDPLRPDAIGDVGAAGFVLCGPLLPGDLGPELRAFLRACGRPVDLGVQGLVRRFAAGGVVTLCPSPELDLPPIRVLAGDEVEIMALAGEEDPISAAEKLAGRWAEEVVLTRAEQGARIVTPHSPAPIEIAAVPPRRIRSTVGPGDTFLAVYGWERHAGASPSDAGARAAEAATRLIEEGCGVPGTDPT